jgi:AP-3 complex subunit beta
MIAPIMMLAIKESVRDMSPYVRKVAAHAIPKLFVLDAEQKTELIDAIDFLLADKTTVISDFTITYTPNVFFSL